MTEDEFKSRLDAIQTEYAARRDGAEAYQDQELARLFRECRWTQQEIAQRMGRAKSWVSYRLNFGAFLQFSTVRGNSFSGPDSLTEWRFREAWQKAGKGHRKETEEDRFARVAQILQRDPASFPGHYGNLIKKPGIRKAVIEAISSDKKLNLAAITDLVNESIPGTDRAQVQKALGSLQQRPPHGMKFDAQHYGNTHKYRLVPRRNGDSPIVRVNPERAGVIAAEVLPILDQISEIVKEPVAGQQTTLAIQCVWRVQQMIKSLLIPEEVV